MRRRMNGRDSWLLAPVILVFASCMTGEAGWPSSQTIHDLPPAAIPGEPPAADDPGGVGPAADDPGGDEDRGEVAAAGDAGAPDPRPAYTPGTIAALPPAPPREFRGVWIAAVSNIDWPSRRNLSTAEQQAELIAMLDEAVRLNLNTVILQVRPAGDALYASSLEPWSEYLTGEQGRPPVPFYDPLAFAIEQAHARGLELHAWFNPFRARHPSARSAAAPSHISRRRPDLVRTYGTHLWMDPSEPDVRAHALAVILDVVRRYDVDGVHIDDYFYPYVERDRRNRAIPFPDDRNYERYRAAGGRLARDDWRRSHVDAFVQVLYDTVKAEKRWVKVGISPFGIWRPGHPTTVYGLDAFAVLYADARKWLNEGWLDYMVPQLYWLTAAPQQPYVDLLSWWVGENHRDRLLVAGNHPNRVGASPRDWPSFEILEQVRLTRADAGASGNVHFSMQSLRANKGGIADALREQVYATPALVPAAPWLGDEPPPAPDVHTTVLEEQRSLALSIHPNGARPAAWIVQHRVADAWQTVVLPSPRSTFSIEWNELGPPDVVAVRAVSRTGVAGEAAVLVRR